MRVAAIQSNYIPWKGYFDIINDVDLFIFHDDLQYTKQDWRNRNKIYTMHGALSWLTVPCGINTDRMICEVILNNNSKWAQKHWNVIRQAYYKAPYYNKYKSFFEYVYLECKWEYLSELNQFLIKHIATEFLGIRTEFSDSRCFFSSGKKSEKLLSLLVSAGCNEYLSGPAARAYLDEPAFQASGIRVVWKDYSGYPEYQQMWQPFESNVSIIDLLMNVGEEAPYYIWGWRG